MPDGAAGLDKPMNDSALNSRALGIAQVALTPGPGDCDERNREYGLRGLLKPLSAIASIGRFHTRAPKTVVGFRPVPQKDNGTFPGPGDCAERSPQGPGDCAELLKPLSSTGR